jgi:hypothetical protein
MLGRFRLYSGLVMFTYLVGASPITSHGDDDGGRIRRAPDLIFTFHLSPFTFSGFPAFPR